MISELESNCIERKQMKMMQTLFLVIAVLSPIYTFGQSADSREFDRPFGAQISPVRQGTLAAQAKRGEIPFSFAYAQLKPDTQKTRRLSPISLPPQPDEMGKPMQIGVNREIKPPLSLSSDSTAFNVDDGKVYLFGILSEGAKSIRARFSQLDLPEGARIFVLPPGNSEEFYGPFTNQTRLSDGTFWTPPVRGEVIVIECFIPNGIKTLSNVFHVSEVEHGFVSNGHSLLGTALPCHNDVDPGYANMAAAVGYIEFVDSASPDCKMGCGCTATLLNTASVSSAPYLLTANHCIRNQATARTLRVYWNYNSGDSPPPGTPYTDGADLLSTSIQSDFALLKLTGTVPAGLNYSGWDGGNAASDSLVVGIHHPVGSHKRISFGLTNPLITGCPAEISALCENFIRVDWTSGIIQPGSSGSGLFNTASNGGRLVGNLWGGKSTCGPGPDWYGRFSLTYHKISSYIADATCTYGLSSNGNNFSPSGGSGSFNTTTNRSCYQAPVITQPTTIQTFTNPASINVADRSSDSGPPGLANLYPSVINVSGLSGTVTRVRVKLLGLNHTFPADLDFLLVGPNGQRVILISDTGGKFDVNNLILTIDQSGGALLPNSSAISSGVYRPTNYSGKDSIDLGGIDDFPSPGPGQNVYDNSLQFFYGASPNGAWKLYVVDDENQDTGSMSGGWNLELATTGSSWLNVTSGFGYGDNTVNYTVASNPSGQPSRTGIINVGGQTHTVFQNAEATPTPTPTPPAFATVDGKVLTSAGRGLRNAAVSITDSQGVVLTATTSSFGFFSFPNVATGETYTFRVTSRLYRFTAQTVQVNGNLTLPDFVGLE